MKKLLFAFVLVAFALLVPFVPGQKLDCNKPHSSAEQAECADQELTSAEADLKGAISDAVQQFSESTYQGNTPLPKGEEKDQRRWEDKMRHSILASQKTWLKYRAAACNSIAVMYDGGTITASAVPSCQAALTRERTKFLRDYFTEK